MKVLIVDDHVLFREGLDGILRARPEFEVVGEAGTVCEAVEIARQHKPCLILMDWALPDGNGAQATEQILAESPDSKIVFLTIYEADENLFAAIRSGAKGYLLKNISSKKLVQALLDVEQGKSALSKAMTARLMEGFSQTSTEAKPSNKPFERLSTRELEVLQEVANGAPNREIAQTLFISENTVKHHMHNILDKLGVENRHQAAKYARQYGLR